MFESEKPFKDPQKVDLIPQVLIEGDLSENAIDQILNKPAEEIKDSLNKGSGGTLDDKQLPSEEVLERMHAKDEYDMIRHKRWIEIGLLWFQAIVFLVITLAFLALSAYWVYQACTDSTWVTKFQAITDILHTGWVAVIAVMATKFEGRIFRDHRKKNGES